MVEPYCSLYGESFDLLQLERDLNIPLAHKTIRGEISERGRYKGKPYPYSACDVVVPDDIPNENKIEWLADIIAKNIEQFKKHKAEDVVFWIVWRGIQGNMEFTTTELQKIASLKIPLCMNYYYLDDDE